MAYLIFTVLIAFLAAIYIGFCMSRKEGGKAFVSFMVMGFFFILSLFAHQDYIEETTIVYHVVMIENGEMMILELSKKDLRQVLQDLSDIEKQAVEEEKEIKLYEL